jgi:hypothetical protein
MHRCAAAAFPGRTRAIIRFRVLLVRRRNDVTGLGCRRHLAAVRRLDLLHGILAFLFNVVVLALVIIIFASVI